MAPIVIHGNRLDPETHADLPADASGTNFILVQTFHPMTEAEMYELHSHGAVSQQREDENTYLCRYEPHSLAVLEALPFVRHAIVYHPNFVIHPSLQREDLTQPDLGVQTKESQCPGEGTLCEVNIKLHDDTGKHGDDVMDEVLRNLPPDTQASTLGSSRYRVRAWVPVRSLGDVAAIDYVKGIFPAQSKISHTVSSRAIMQVPPANGVLQPMWATLGYPDQRFQGRGETITVHDTGLDTANFGTSNTHPAFGDRIRNTSKIVTINNVPFDLSDRDGHGTHVAGCALGDRQRLSMNWLYSVTNSMCGTAPAAQLYVQRRDDTGQVGFEHYMDDVLAQVPIPLAHVNAWSGAEKLTEDYDSSDADIVDRYTARRDELLLVWSAGNDGDHSASFGDQKDLMRQIRGVPAAKNALSVGATWSSRNMAPRTGDLQDILLYNEGSCIEGVWFQPTGSGRYPSESVAFLSNKGPTPEGFLKPDVVAPGVGILSAWSRHDDAQKDKNKVDVNGVMQPSSLNYCRYNDMSYLSGTSHAAPQVAGLAACVREAALSKHTIPLRGVTVKAIIINAAVSCRGGYFWSVVPPLAGQRFHRRVRTVLGDPPDGVQGHGAVNYERSIEHTLETNKNAYAGFYEHNGLRTGVLWPGAVLNEQEYDGFVYPRNTDTKVQITLAYNDAQGRILQNELRLRVYRQAWNAGLNTHRPLDTPATPLLPTLENRYPGQDMQNIRGTDPIQLGCVQKLTVPNFRDQMVLQNGETIRFAMTVQAGPYRVLGVAVKFSLAWLCEPGP